MMKRMIPKRRIGLMTPLAIIDSSPYEFYCYAPAGVLLELIACGLREFSRENAEQTLSHVDRFVDLLMERNVDLIQQSGVPPSLLVGLEAHDQLMRYISARTGKPATSQILNVVAASRNVGIRKIVAANRWADKMNETLAEFFARGGIELVGVSSEVMPAGTIQKRTLQDGIDLAVTIGRRAFREYPRADGLYIGGSGWMAQPAVERLEAEFDKPVVANQNAAIWNTMHLVDYWTPVAGHGRVLGSA